MTSGDEAGAILTTARAVTGRAGRSRARLTAVTALAAVLALASPQAATAAVADPEPACTEGTGPYQRELEAHLHRPVDGVQSPADCAAIRTFQQANGIDPADGYPDLATYQTMVALEARPHPNAAGGCPVRSYRVTCVDLERQLLWVQTGNRVVFPPVPIRTGRDDQETRPGWHEVYWRNKDHHSTLYDSPMPYAQFFDGGQALHGRPGDFYAGGGSAGCVNLHVPDAARLWDLLTEGDAVYVWGTKPGTDD